jgi:nicotinamidase-related amidase
MDTIVDTPLPSGRHADVALLIIDVQQGLFNRSTPIYNAQGLLDNITTLVECAHRAGVPVVYVQHANQGSLAEGTQDWQLHPRLHPLDKDWLIHKRHGSAFQATPLKARLEADGIARLVVTGLVTHGCVRATCLDAVKLGYQVVLVQDGHSNFHKQAAQLIEEWNHKLGESGIELRAAQEISFGDR